MDKARKGVLAATVICAMFGAGALGAWLAVPASSGAATNGMTQASTSGPSGSSSVQFHSNEDPAHEKSESPQREADENSGKAHFGGAFHSNEDPAHEKSESAQREADENAGRFPTGR